MQNKDLSRFFPDNPKSNKVRQFVRYNDNGEIEGLPPAETFVGTLTLDHNPTQQELSEFVVETLGREPKVNDKIDCIITIGGKTTTSEYKYNGEAWSGHELPGVELAENGAAGIVEGNYSLEATADLLLDIVNGVIRNIYIKDGSGYRNLVTYINSNSGEIANIINGITEVGSAAYATDSAHATSADSATSADYATSAGSATSATSATNDGLGNEISETYLDKSSGATKSYVDDKVKFAKENKNISENDWVSDPNIAPFAYKYATTFSSANMDYQKVVLIADPIILAKYGLVIGVISGNNITFYAQTIPNESISLTLFFEHWQEVQLIPATDEFGVPLTDEFGTPLTLS